MADSNAHGRPDPKWTRLMPGVYDDNCGGLHLVMAEVLAGAGYQDTPANRQTLIDAAREAFGETLVVDE